MQEVNADRADVIRLLIIIIVAYKKKYQNIQFFIKNNRNHAYSGIIYYNIIIQVPTDEMAIETAEHFIPIPGDITAYYHWHYTIIILFQYASATKNSFQLIHYTRQHGRKHKNSMLADGKLDNNYRYYGFQPITNLPSGVIIIVINSFA